MGKKKGRNRSVMGDPSLMSFPSQQQGFGPQAGQGFGPGPGFGWLPPHPGWGGPGSHMPRPMMPPPAMKKKFFRCHICQLSVPCQQTLNAHVMGAKHKRKAKNMEILREVTGETLDSGENKGEIEAFLADARKQAETAKSDDASLSVKAEPNSAKVKVEAESVEDETIGANDSVATKVVVEVLADLLAKVMGEAEGTGGSEEQKNVKQEVADGEAAEGCDKTSKRFKKHKKEKKSKKKKFEDGEDEGNEAGKSEKKKKKKKRKSSRRSSSDDRSGERESKRRRHRSRSRGSQRRDEDDRGSCSRRRRSDRGSRSAEAGAEADNAADAHPRCAEDEYEDTGRRRRGGKSERKRSRSSDKRHRRQSEEERLQEWEERQKDREKEWEERAKEREERHKQYALKLKEDAKQYWARPPIREQLLDVLKCDVCDLELNSPKSLAMHLVGEKHKRNQEMFERCGGKMPKKQAALNPEELSGLPEGITCIKLPGKQAPGHYHCGPCNCILNSEVQMKDHIPSEKHQCKLNGLPWPKSKNRGRERRDPFRGDRRRERRGVDGPSWKHRDPRDHPDLEKFKHIKNNFVSGGKEHIRYDEDGKPIKD